MKTTRLLAAMLLAAGLLQLPVAHAVSAGVAKPLKEASDLVRAGKGKEAIAKLNVKAKDPKLAKSDRTLINKFCVGEVDAQQIAHLLK